MAKNEKKCPFTGEALEMHVSEDGHARVSSPHGWQSKVFTSEAAARAWLLSTDLLALEPEIAPLSLGRFMVRSGAGWFSTIFNTKAGAEEWAATRPKRGRKPKKETEVVVGNDQMPDILQYEDD